MKDLCQKQKVKLIFEAPETVWWLDLTDPDPILYDRLYATANHYFLCGPSCEAVL